MFLVPVWAECQCANAFPVSSRTLNKFQARLLSEGCAIAQGAADTSLGPTPPRWSSPPPTTGTCRSVSPHWLSPQGRSVDTRTSSEFLPFGSGIQMPRDAAHEEVECRFGADGGTRSRARSSGRGTPAARPLSLTWMVALRTPSEYLQNSLAQEPQSLRYPQKVCKQSGGVPSL